MDHNLATRIYQFDQQRLDIHSKSDERLKQFLQSLDLPCNDNMK